MLTFIAFVHWFALVFAITTSVAYLTKLSMLIAAQHSGNPTSQKIGSWDALNVGLFWATFIATLA